MTPRCTSGAPPPRERPALESSSRHHAAGQGYGIGPERESVLVARNVVVPDRGIWWRLSR